MFSHCRSRRPLRAAMPSSVMAQLLLRSSSLSPVSAPIAPRPASPTPLWLMISFVSLHESNDLMLPQGAGRGSRRGFALCYTVTCGTTHLCCGVVLPQIISKHPRVTGVGRCTVHFL